MKISIVTLCLATATAAAHAAVVFQIDDFQDGTTQSWVGGASPLNIATGGPAGSGDGYLQLESNGTQGPGANLATKNESAGRVGDYRAAGAQRIVADFLNPGATALEIRAALVVANINKWTSTEAFTVPADGAWHRGELWLLESEMTLVGGALDYDTMIQGVETLLLRHDDNGPSNGGTSIAATLGIDNVQLLPGGDFDDDGLVNAADIDALVAVIAAGNHTLGFDLDGDALVNHSDLKEWLTIAGSLNLGAGETYLVGDANLDGTVDGQDFVAWNGSKFTQTAAWSAGDFNASGNVDGQDFVLWNANKFMSSDPVQLPEPTAALWSWLACLFWRRQ